MLKAILVSLNEKTIYIVGDAKDFADVHKYRFFNSISLKDEVYKKYFDLEVLFDSEDSGIHFMDGIISVCFSRSDSHEALRKIEGIADSNYPVHDYLDMKNCNIDIQIIASTEGYEF